MKLVKDILTEDKLTGERADEIDVTKQGQKCRDTVSTVKNTLRKNNLEYLSAPALGIDARVFCINFTDSEVKTFINPVIVSSKGIRMSKETSYLFPGKTFIRPRNTDIEIIYQRPTGQVESRKVSGYAAVVMQQMVDELDGVYLTDIGLEIDADFENATEEERQEVIDAYLDSLDIKRKSLEHTIETDSNLKEISDAIKFNASVASGETKTEKIKMVVD